MPRSDPNTPSSSSTTSSPRPKGRHHRCSFDFVIDGRTLAANECAWLLRDGDVVRLKSAKQLSDQDETVVVTRGHRPAVGDFGGPVRSGWAGQANRATLKAPRAVGSATGARPRLAVTDGPDARHVHQLAEAVARRGGRALVVGGAVRDAMMAQLEGRQLVPKDIDIEVFGIEAGELQALVEARHRVDLAGASFAVLKIHGSGIDISLPRRESKQGQGHRGFLVDSDPTMTVAQAAQRRDFTINAMSYDPLTGELLDPVGGAGDLLGRRLRHVGPQFGEDPLRVLRGAQFVARFSLEAQADTVALCRTLRQEQGTLAVERIYDETVKLLLKGTEPGRGVRFLHEADWLGVWPGVGELDGVVQDPRWHPEGDVLIHTAWALDAWARLGRVAKENGMAEGWDEHDELVTGLAVLAHDLGKASCTAIDESGAVRSPGHEAAGVEPAVALVRGLSRQAPLADEVGVLVRHHLAPVQLHGAGASDSAVRRLANKVGRLDRLVRVAHADQAGRPPPGAALEVGPFAAGDWLMERAAALGVEKSGVVPLAKGRDVIAAGVAPGPAIGSILRALADAQESGAVTDRAGALAFVTQAAEAATH